MKRFLSIFLALVMLLAVMPVYASAAETTSPSCEAPESGTFVPMTKEDYARYVAILENGSDLERASAVREIFERGNSAISPYSWSSTVTDPMGDGTYLVQGFVTCSHTQNNMTVYTTVPASMRGSNTAGYTWVSYDSGYSSAASGSYTYTGNVSVSLLAPNRMYIAVYGHFEIAASTAASIGVNLSLMNYSYSVSGTDYYRSQFNGSHIEYSPTR